MTRFHNDFNRDNGTSNTSKLKQILKKPFYSFPKGYLMICIQLIFSLYVRIIGHDQTVCLPLKNVLQCVLDFKKIKTFSM